MSLVGWSSLASSCVPSLLAYLVPPCGSHRLIRHHGFRCLPHPLASPHRLIDSPMPRIAWLPVSSTSRAGRGRDRRRESRRAADGGGRAVIVAGLRLLACLGAMDGAARSSLLPISSAQSNRLRFPVWSIPSLIISSTGMGFLFPFRPTPSRLFFSVCLPRLAPPSPAGGCVGCGMACGGGRRGLLACVLISRFALSLPLVRSLLYNPCRSCRSFLLGVLWGVLWAILPAILSALAFLETCP